MERMGTQWRGRACHGKWEMHGSSQRLWTEEVILDTVSLSSTRDFTLFDQHMGWESGKVHPSRSITWDWCFWCLLHNRTVAEGSITNPNRHPALHGQHVHGDWQGMSRGTEGIRKWEIRYLDYPRLSTKISTTYHHTSCGIASTTRTNKDIANYCCRLLDTNHL